MNPRRGLVCGLFENYFWHKEFSKLFLYNDSFNIKYPTKIHIALKQKKNPKQQTIKPAFKSMSRIDLDRDKPVLTC